jgi:hypothetical protein
MALNREVNAVSNDGGFAIDSWEDEGGALRYAPPKKVVPRPVNPFAMLALVAVAATGFYVLFKTLISGRNCDES